MSSGGALRYAPVPQSDLEPLADTKLGSKPHSSSQEAIDIRRTAHEAHRTATRTVIYATACCLLWLTCSSALILANKYILVDLKFSYPIAVSALGMAFASIAAWTYCDLLLMAPGAEFVDARFFMLKIFPVGATQALCLALGNQLYLLLTVAFIEMSRASLPVTTMLGLWIARVETPTNQVIRAVSLTAVGCAVAAYGEVHLSLLGAAFMVANLTMESVRLVMTQFLLLGVELPAMQALKFIAPSATICLLGVSAIQEYPRMKASGALRIPQSHPGFFFLAATLGLVVNVLGVLIIKLSSATTLKVIAAVRGPIVVLLGVCLFGETVTALEAFGYSIALLGFVWYNWAKSNQTINSAAKSAA